MEVETETEMDETETAKDAGTGSRQRCAKPPSLTRLCSRLVPAMGHWLYITTTLTYLVGGLTVQQLFAYVFICLLPLLACPIFWLAIVVKHLLIPRHSVTLAIFFCYLHFCHAIVLTYHS